MAQFPDAQDVQVIQTVRSDRLAGDAADLHAARTVAFPAMILTVESSSVAEARPAGGTGWCRSLLLGLLVLAVLGPTIVQREVMPPDEPRFALVAREMYESRDPILPVRAGEPYLDKPPLLFWAVAVAFWLFGEANETAARVPSLVASILLAIALHREALRWVGEPRATRAVLILASCMLVLLRGAWLAPDAIFSSLVFLAVASGARASTGSRSAALAASTWLALALLTKGPLALALVLLAWLAARLAGFSGFRFAPLVWPPAVALLLALTLPWPVALAIRLDGIEPMLAAWWRHTATRYLDSWDNLEPWWYYGRALLAGLFPWSLLVLPAFAFRSVRRELSGSRVCRWLGLWCLATILMLSVSAGKRSAYFQPLLPACAVIAASTLSAALSERWARRWLSATATISAAPLVALAVGFLAAPAAIFPIAQDRPEPALRVAAALLLLTCAASLALVAVSAARGRGSLFWWPAAFALAAGFSFPLALTPVLNVAQNARAATDSLVAAVPSSARLASCNSKWEILAWYGRRPISLVATREQALQALSGAAPTALICRARELPPPATWPAGTRVAGSAVIGTLRLHLILRDPSTAAGVEGDRPRERDHEPAARAARPPAVVLTDSGLPRPR